MADWLWSTALYTAALAALVGAAGVIKPLRLVHRRSRRRALAMLVLAVAVIVVVRTVTPSTHMSASTHAIDEFLPVYQFREYHETFVSAPPERAFDAIKTVAADEIALFKLFTWIRRFGRSGPESLLNPPDAKPILDVALSTGFMLLAERVPREIVLGTVLVAPAGLSRQDITTADHFKHVTQPGAIKAVMNFRAEPAAGGTRVITETRVVATDTRTLKLFTAYWRTIFPGSAILRVTWLRAVKARAERRSS